MSHSEAVFVPLTDAQESGGAVPGPLVPYNVDRPCFRWLKDGIEDPYLSPERRARLARSKVEFEEVAGPGANAL